MPTQEQIRTCFILCYRNTKMYLPIYSGSRMEAIHFDLTSIPLS
ncbi:DUF6888 family protein [Nostoc sp.]